MNEEDISVKTKVRKLLAFLSRIYNAILTPFCPCALRIDPTKLSTRNSRFDKTLHESLQLRVFKSLLGFLAGIGIGILTYLFLLHVTQTFSGPVVNISQNLNVLSQSLSCQQEALRNKTMDSLRNAFNPLRDHWEAIKRVLRAARQFAALVREAFQAFLQLFKEILDAIRRTWRWLKKILDVCPKLMELPEEECKSYLAGKQDECMKIMTILFFLCYLVKAFADSACPLLRLAQVACVRLELLKERTYEPLKRRMEDFFQTVHNGFYFNVTTDSYYNYTVNQSQTYSDVAASILNEIRTRSYGLLNAASIGAFILSFTFLLVLLKALHYRSRYLSNDRYDNIYITNHVRHLDRIRSLRGQETILPLGYFERRKYVRPLSPWLLPKERKAVCVAIFTLINCTVQISVYLLFDYLLFWLMDRISFYGRTRIAAPVPFRVKIEVDGGGLLADMFKDMVDAFAPLMSSVPALDMSGCLPEPIPPDVPRRRAILLLLLLCYILCFVRAYGLRLRHLVCSCYYPEREHARASYLVNHIFRTRGGFLKYFRRKIRLNKQNEEPEHKPTFLDVLSGKNKFFRWTLNLAGHGKDFCLGCGTPKSESKKFTSCESPGCGSQFCQDCFEELEGHCTACQQPFEYDDLSDVSESVSSDDVETDREKREKNLVDEDFAYQYRSFKPRVED